MSNSLGFEEFKAKAIEKLMAGVPLSGKDGVLVPLLENLLNSALEGEMDSHLDGVEREMGNRRNGLMNKRVQISMGEVTINTPLDRDGTFDPQVVRKREKILADSLADRIIGLYAIGNSTREISDILEEQFGNRISAETISSITDRVLLEIQSWKNQPLDRVYPIVWLDAVHYKVMDEKNRPVTRAIYNVLALTCEGRKELLACTYPGAMEPTSGSVCLRIFRTEESRISSSPVLTGSRAFRMRSQVSFLKLRFSSASYTRYATRSSMWPARTRRSSYVT